MKFTQDMFATHMRDINGSAIREIFKLLAKPGMISFAGGNPSNSALEPDVISRLSVEVLEKYGTSLLQYGATDGFGPFRESAAAFLNTASVKCSAESLLPVQGGSQAFDLLLKALINPGDVILCESPTFLGAIQAMREYNAKLIPMPTDDEGVIVEAAEELIKKCNAVCTKCLKDRAPEGIEVTEGTTLLANLMFIFSMIATLCEEEGLTYPEDKHPGIIAFN